MTPPLWLYVISRNLSDCPGWYVVRRWAVTGEHATADRDPWVLASTAPAARAALPPGLTSLGRQAADDRAIFEVWL